ncbi:MAG: hypothetical protein AAGE01_15490 [Pseudomonadota bacterium]
MKRLASSLLALGWLLTTPVQGQEVEDELIEHIVVAGDTIRGITTRYLGSEYAWQDNWKLNPHIKDPDLLRIGDRLTIIKSRTIEAERATVAEVVQSVDKALQSGPWQNATVGDELVARDGVRTLADSFATLRYNDRTSVRLDPYSQIYLTDRERDLRGTDRGTIEIIEGGAALSWEPLVDRSPRTDITVVSGSAQTRLDGSRGVVSLHAAQDEDKAARLSMFEGRGEVSAGGESVQLSKGLGVAVEEGGTPGAPERLLPRPETRSPARGDALSYDNPRLEWTPVEEAEGYRVEVCGDVDCELPIYQAELASGETRIVASSLGAGNRFWRVQAISETGLLGYASRLVPFTVTRDWTDTHAPGVLVTVVDAPLQASDEAVRTAPSGQLLFQHHDDASGEVSVYYRWNEAPFAVWDGSALALPATAARLEFYATDRLANRSPTHRVDILHDR